jgi:uncharacterized membrane protein YedE/YeeE
MKRQYVVSFVTGALFAVGLGISGMTQPAKVIAFLDVFGAWDPSLAFVMVGAIGVHLLANLWTRRPEAQPVFAERFNVPTNRKIDGRLLAGAALFGLGWGAAGFCPGPAVVSSVTLASTTLIFVGAMLSGMVLHALLLERRSRRVIEPPMEAPKGFRRPLW